MRKYIIGNGNQGIFFAKHSPCFADNGKPVHIRVDHKTYMGLMIDNRVAQFVQVLGQRFGIMREKPGRFAIKFNNIIYTQRLQQFGDGDPPC